MSDPSPRIRRSDPEAIAEAAAILKAGGLVAFPTETVYGLGADARDDAAVAGIFAAKGRPRFNPLIAHFGEWEAAEEDVVFDARAERLAAACWPGPLTLVLPRRPDCRISLLCSAGLETQAVRVPDQAVARALLRSVGRPLAAPSANRSGRISPTAAQAVESELGKAVDLILDDGPCRIGLESTVLDLSGERPRLLRPGGLPLERLIDLLGEVPEARAANAPLASPGLLESHYAPQTPLRLDAAAATAEEGLLAFGPDVPAGAAMTLNLSPSGDLTEAAANLFAYLRRLDAAGLPAIAAMPVPEQGLGHAIRDRLRRAAAPRPAPAPHSTP
ncbi:L-threonylcarbamoyladenylate synthase [Algihabitans albus]|uniref:L-threonylcarbamoyladenylate synthase n=1 Tax=Algihabitans albus TaxID=2164067 RepID=UPI000E5D2500|nr:L-threonylcarbamoyladenylate synthase [Algihabitans albus]